MKIRISSVPLIYQPVLLFKHRDYSKFFKYFILAELNNSKIYIKLIKSR